MPQIDTSNRPSSIPPPQFDKDDDGVTELANSKIREAHSTHSLASLIGRKFTWLGNKIDGFFGNWFSRCYSHFFGSKSSNDFELKEISEEVIPGLEEIPIDECFSAEEIDIIATKNGYARVGEMVLIKGIYGYRLIEIDKLDGDDVIIKDFYEIKTHIDKKDIWHFKPMSEISNAALKAKVIELTISKTKSDFDY